MPVVADIAVVPLAAVAGISVIVLILPVVVAEALILWILRWAGLGRSAMDALIMNVSSALVGAALVYVAYEVDSLLSMLVALLIAWVLSTVIEAGVLWVLRRQAVRRTTIVASIANAASYLMLTVFVMYAI